MAKAPRPGVGARNDAADAASKVMELTIRGETVRLGVGTVTIDDRALVRKHMHGLPVESFLDGETFGLDSLFIIWWLSKRQAVPSYSFAQAREEFPDDLTPDDVELGEVDAGDSPEA